MSHDYSLGEIATHLEAQLRGDPEARITGLNSLKNACQGQLAFLSNAKYAGQLVHCKAEAVILTSAQAASYTGSCLIMSNPYFGYAKISAWFDNAPKQSAGVHPSAVVHPSARLKDGVFLGPNVVVEAGAVLNAGCRVEANCFIGARSILGAECRLAANVTIYHDVIIGDHVRIHSGAVIGADGFGFAPNGTGGYQKIHQIGGVQIGNNVEIGACTTIDRGALENTKVGNGVIIDNHVQIAHNAEVGDNTAMAAYSGVAGSSIVGANCTLAGFAGLVGHISICDNVVLTGRALATKSITQPGVYSSSVSPLLPNLEWRKNSVRISQLDSMARRIKELEKREKQ
ncbi:MAG: UDP-3-O-(3-hydroxymyristoyl)glucosamine N-acyltransferase [Porticoccaceae bacterium]|nr:UDP-3-O-(3-hydroxymyristoyl)glucosamine N-acyltransferase [Porticoccaceae bacterium]MDG1306863.1 UDP-3-O-(3-hydroxymyristoyl)glucosamine N-acyltransferase [Porticoccaceae bacterium]